MNSLQNDWKVQSIEPIFPCSVSLWNVMKPPLKGRAELEHKDCAWACLPSVAIIWYIEGTFKLKGANESVISTWCFMFYDKNYINVVNIKNVFI
jgi:hypothetical protein